MSRRWWAKILVLLPVLTVAGAVVWLSVFFKGDARFGLVGLPSYFRHSPALGLGWTGGTSFVMEVDTAMLEKTAFERELRKFQYAWGKLAQGPTPSALREGCEAVEEPTEFRVRLRCKSYGVTQQIESWLAESGSSFNTVTEKNNEILLSLGSLYLSQLKTEVVNQAAQVASLRVEEFSRGGSVVKLGASQLEIGIPNAASDNAQVFLAEPKLELRLLDTSKSLDDIAALVSEAEAKNSQRFRGGDLSFSDYAKGINELLKPSIPNESELLFGREDAARVPYLVRKSTWAKPETVRDVRQVFETAPGEQYKAPRILIRFSPGSTAPTVAEGQVVVVVLDGVVQAALPVVAKTEGKAVAPNSDGLVLGLGLGSYQDLVARSSALTTTLQAGLMQTSLRLVSSNVVPSDAAAENIKNLTRSLLLGMVLVLLFFLAAFRICGFFAALSIAASVLCGAGSCLLLGVTFDSYAILGFSSAIFVVALHLMGSFLRIRNEVRSGVTPLAAWVRVYRAGLRRFAVIALGSAAAVLSLNFIHPALFRGISFAFCMGILSCLFCLATFFSVVMEWYLQRFDIRFLKI